MVNKISYAEYEELLDIRSFGTKKEFHNKLEVYGIEAKPYTAYQYFDGGGNYIGDSEFSDLRQLLENAYIYIGEYNDNNSVL